MLTRRDLLTGGVLAATGSPGAPVSQAGQQHGSGSSSDTDERLTKAVESINEVLKAASGANPPELATIRQLQREFLKGHGKFPDFIDVGIDVWEILANWHVRTRQPLQVTRTADSRYSMAVFQTNIVLRHDVSNNYIGQPYDGK